MPAALASLCVFCGSSTGRRPEYALAARELGRLMAQRGIRLIYGGGNVGLMGVLADEMLSRGGQVIGVIPRRLVERELAHAGATEMHIVGSMHERKALMAELAEAFAALPGGIGTLEELLEIATWSQLGLHNKPIGLLNVCDHYRPLAALLTRATEEGFLPSENQRLITIARDAHDLLDRLSAAMPQVAEQAPNLESQI